MGVNSLPSAWRTNLRTGAIQDRDLRFYLDPRGVEYPDLGTGSAVYSLAREDNLIDRGNCESVTAPMMLGETVPLLSNATFARDAMTGVGTGPRGGGYAYKLTKTIAAGTGGIAFHTDNNNAGDMHGYVAGETYPISEWVYIPTASGIDPSEVRAKMQDTVGSTEVQATKLDAWEELTYTHTVDAGATNCTTFVFAQADAAVNEYFYVDDIRQSTHTVPGSHYLSSGYVETLCPMTEKFTIQLDFIPAFAFDTASNQGIFEWYIDATHFLRVFYGAGSDKFNVSFYDGGNQRNLQSAQYDDGSAFRNINQRISMTFAIDLSTGSTAGSSLWMDKTQDDTTWDGAIDAKTSEFNKALIRRSASLNNTGDYDIAYVRRIDNLVATDAQVQADFKDVANEEIFWSLDGHGTGKTRCNVSPFFTRYDEYKGVTAKLAASHGTNTLNFTLKNLQGEFSDDQYAAFVPTSFQYNGTDTDDQRYLTRRMGASLESWYSGDFEHLYVGRMTEAGLRRSSMNPRISEVEGSLEDGIGDIDRTFETNGRKYDSYDIVDATESNSLFHTIAHLADRNNVQYLANNSFENADITLSWLVTAGGTLNKDAADGFFGSASGELIPGAAAEQAYQTVQFTGSRKLNVGETYTFWCWVKSTGAASGADNYIDIEELDGGVSKGSTSAVYVLAGGEGYKLAFASHTVIDSDSDELRVHVSGDAGDTINIDGCMLVPVRSAYNYFSVNTANGIAGVESADDAVGISWPWFGIDANPVDIVHPWRRVEEGTSIWENLKSLANASGPKYCGMSEANTLTLKAILQTDYSDDVPIDTWTTARQNIGVTLDVMAANKIVGHGVKIVKATNGRLIWAASATGNFIDSLADNVLTEVVANGAVWPSATDYPGGYWALYGKTDDRWLNENIMEYFHESWNPYLESGTSPEQNAGYINSRRQYAVGPMPTSKRDNIIGLQDADLQHKLSDTGEGAGGFTETVFDVDTKAGSANILLTNSTGVSKTLRECIIIGKPVYLYEGVEGWLHDGFADNADIARNGERKLEFGSGDIVESTQLDKLADYLWKNKSKRKHVYALTFAGTTHDVSPSDNYTINIGNAGETEYITSRAEVISVRMEQQAGSLGVTQVLLRELEEAWKYDSNVISRFNARGVLVQSPSTGAVVSVGSEYSTVNTDYRISIGDTSAETTINAAIDFVNGAFGGGTVHLLKGTYKIDGAVIMKANVELLLEDGAIIEKNSATQAIVATGAGGSELENVVIQGGTIRGNDTNDFSLIKFDFCDNFIIRDVNIEASYKYGVELANCDGGVIETNTIDDFKLDGVHASSCTDLRILGNFIKNGGVYGIWTDAGNDNLISNNQISVMTNTTTIVSGIRAGDTDSVISNNMIRSLTASAAGNAVGISCDSQNCQILNNAISALITASTASNSYGIIISAANITAQNNRIYNITSTGTRFIQAIIGSGANNCIITGNNIYDLDISGTAGNISGIVLISSSGTVVSNNLITDCDLAHADNDDDVYGVRVLSSCANVIVEGNRVSALSISGGGAGLTYGVYSDADGDNIGVNNIRDIDDFGIFIVADYNSVSANYVTGCDTGIEIDTTANDTVLTGNLAISNTTDFIDNGINTFAG